MTNEQRAALEALAGRPLTPDEVAKITPLVASGSTQAIADILSVGRPPVLSRDTITTRGAAALFPSLMGLPRALSFQLAHRKLASFAAAAKASPDLPTSLLAEAVELQLLSFRDMGLDFGDPELRGMLDHLATIPATQLTQAEANGFKALAERDAPPITHTQVGAALQ